MVFYLFALHGFCFGLTLVLSNVWTQNSENYVFNPNITFYISLNKYIKLINSFVLGDIC